MRYINNYIYLCTTNKNNLILKPTTMKNTFIGVAFLAIVWLSSCGSSARSEKNPESAIVPNSYSEDQKALQEPVSSSATEISAVSNTTVIQLTKAMFLEKVYDYEKNPKKWTYKGDKPCIIDFYADWCRPCKMVAPIMAELAEKYQGDLIIYKVNTDQERELAQFFGIRSIPTVFFCPPQGDPQMTQGALPKETYEKVITEVLLPKK